MPGLPLILEEDGSPDQKKTPSEKSLTLHRSCQNGSILESLHDHQHILKPDDSGANYFDKLSNKKERIKEECDSDPNNVDVNSKLETLTYSDTINNTKTLSHSDQPQNSGSLNGCDGFKSDQFSSQHIDKWIHEIELANEVGLIEEADQDHHPISEPSAADKSKYPSRKSAQHDQDQSKKRRLPHSVQQQHVVPSSTPASSAVSKVPHDQRARAPVPGAAGGCETRSMPTFSRSATVGVMESRSSSRRSARGGIDTVRDDETSGASSALDLIHKYYHSMSEFSFHQAERREMEV
ncbi:hypothetical protein ElyMa_006787600 [Elysia marginata]|uniref:Uncharacterized protein n=1 Tax=Elysia marginata TaxID=1093978 RepID=A0AAV4J091_9GAST|nr:hypothetical protein ElyMa_006787600 [Elysia marginata]